MWLLKFHFAFSILCMITFIGFVKVFKEQLVQNGWTDGEKKKKEYSSLLVFFVPILNIFCVLVGFMCILVSKKDFEKFREELKEKAGEEDD